MTRLNIQETATAVRKIKKDCNSWSTSQKPIPGGIGLSAALSKSSLMMKTWILLTSLALLILAGCASSPENKNQTRGAGIGAATGGVLGGIIGHQTGNRAAGVIIGAGTGAAIGGYAGHRMDQQAKELNKVAETKRTEEGLLTKLKSDILFDTGKADLKPKAKQSLREMASIMKEYPENVIAVNGYTDDTGPSKLNQELSRQRAETVRNTLVAYGLPEETISTHGYGPADPVADNDTAKGRQQNRRVEIAVRVDESKIPAKK